LASCPDCGKEVSPEAVACPGCGRPLRQVRTAPPARQEKPVVAFILSLLGGFFTLTFGTVAGAGFAFGFYSVTVGPAAAMSAAVVFAVMGMACGAMIIVGAVLQLSENMGRLRDGSVLVLVFALVSIPFTLAGGLIGSILSIVGGVLGLRWKPAAQPPGP